MFSEQREGYLRLSCKESCGPMFGNYLKTVGKVQPLCPASRQTMPSVFHVKHTSPPGKKIHKPLGFSFSFIGIGETDV